MINIPKNERGEPDRIYLQIHGDENPDDYLGQTPPINEQTTWSWEPVFTHDVEYVRADISASRVADLESERADIRAERDAAWDRIEELEAGNDRLRGQLINCVNHLEHAKRRHPRDSYLPAIESANTTLYETQRMGLNSEGKDD